MRGARFKVQGSRFKVQGSRVKGQGSRVKGQGSRVKGQGSRVKGQGSRVKVQGSRFKAKGERRKVMGQFRDVIPAGAERRAGISGFGASMMLGESVISEVPERGPGRQFIGQDCRRLSSRPEWSGEPGSRGSGVSVVLGESVISEVPERGPGRQADSARPPGVTVIPAGAERRAGISGFGGFCGAW